jgi:hypothetical protein
MSSRGQDAQERPPLARTTAGWSGAATCGSRTPREPMHPGRPRGPGPPFPPDSDCHVPLRKRLLSQLCHVSGGSQPFAGCQPNYRIKCGVGGVRVPGSRRGLSTDTSGRYANTTVSPPATEAARHITALRARADSV